MFNMNEWALLARPIIILVSSLLDAFWIRPICCIIELC